MPMMIAPLIWLSACCGAITRPMSCTATNFFIRTRPVSLSTSTCAISRSEPHDDRPVDLALRLLWGNNQADVLHGHELLHPHQASFLIDLDMRHLPIGAP